jgi:hypothetical protein
MNHYKILKHKLYTLGSKQYAHKNLQTMRHLHGVSWRNFLHAEMPQESLTYHSTTEIRKRPNEDQSLFDVWKNIKLVVLRSNQHIITMQANQWVLNHSQTSLCVVQQNKKETTKWHALPSTSAHTDQKILQHKNIPDQVNLYLYLKYSLLKSVLSWHKITQAKKENDRKSLTAVSQE